MISGPLSSVVMKSVRAAPCKGGKKTACKGCAARKFMVPEFHFANRDHSPVGRDSAVTSEKGIALLKRIAGKS